MKDILLIVALPAVGLLGAVGGLYLAVVLIGSALDTPHHPD